MIEFNIEGANVSGGLFSALDVRGLRGQKTFKLDIKKGPLFTYLTSLPNASRFINEFHIGCSTDNRSPSIFYYTPDYRKNEVLYMNYHRTLNGKGGSRFPKDGKGERDLEALAIEFSNLSAYDEKLILGYVGLSGGLCINSHVDVNISNNIIEYIDNMAELYGMGIDGLFLSNAVKNRITDSVLDYKKRPNKKNKAFIEGSWGYDFKGLGVSAGKLVSEIIRLYDGSVGDIKLLDELKFEA
ncbi:MAG: hypothetical protein JSV92_00310 [archaeon]|nr:MAG: hypothetical protein JSV92_00310 [archaeon]